MNEQNSQSSKYVQGFVLAYELRENRLTYKFMRLIPLARVDLGDAVQIRLSSPVEFMKSLARHPLKTRYWWTFGLRCRGSEAPIYLIRTSRKGKSVFLKLKAGMHYRLRVSIHRWSVHYSDEEGQNAVFEFYNGKPEAAESPSV